MAMTQVTSIYVATISSFANGVKIPFMTALAGSQRPVTINADITGVTDKTLIPVSFTLFQDVNSLHPIATIYGSVNNTTEAMRNLPPGEASIAPVFTYVNAANTTVINSAAVLTAKVTSATPTIDAPVEATSNSTASSTSITNGPSGSVTAPLGSVSS